MIRGFDGSLAVERVAQGVHHAAEQARADGDLEQAPRGLAGVSLAQAAGVADDDGADLVLFEVHGKAHDAARKLDHFIEHGVAQPFDAGDAGADGRDGADVFLRGGGGDVADLCFQFLYDVAHAWDG